MTKAVAGVARPAGLGLCRCPAAWAAVIVLTGAGLAWAGHAAWDAIQTWGTPTCSWPVQVHGTASPAALAAGQVTSTSLPPRVRRVNYLTLD